MRSFLGLCNVFRRFVPNFSRIAAPLNKNVAKGQPATFDGLDETEQAAYETLKKALIRPPVLALPQLDGHYIIYTDACDEQVGCVLLQVQPDGTESPVGYFLRTLNNAERNYTTTERECLAVVWSILMLRPYLKGVKFTVRTDHSAMKWILALTSLLDALCGGG